MSLPAMPLEGIEYVPMPVEEFHLLPDEIRAEYSDGVAILMAPARRRHNKIQRRLANAIEAALPDTDVGTDAGVALVPQRRLRIPDVAVFAGVDDPVWADDLPVLVAEVLSPSTRNEDLVRKGHEYAQRGISQYWVVDPEEGTLTVYQNSGDGWVRLIVLDAARPRGEVTVGEHGVVPVDLDALFSA